jgi:hypothetical protein
LIDLPENLPLGGKTGGLKKYGACKLYEPAGGSVHSGDVLPVRPVTWSLGSAD